MIRFIESLELMLVENLVSKKGNKYSMYHFKNNDGQFKVYCEKDLPNFDYGSKVLVTFQIYFGTYTNVSVLNIEKA